MTVQEENYQLKVSIKAIDGIPLIALEGVCDAFTSPFAHGSISALIDEGYKGIIVNIERLELIDVAGFHALDECCMRMSEVGGKLLLVSPTKHVKKIYDILRERESCKILKSIDEARARLKNL